MAVVPEDALLERERELVCLHRVLDDAIEGRGGLVVVEGPAGIGKTRLLQAAIGAGRERGAEVLRAAGGDLERELGFGVVMQLFERRLRRASGRERAELLEGPAAPTASLLDVAGSLSAGAHAQPPALCHGLYWLTCNLGARAPVVIAVDDAHWADRPSLEFLLYLAQRVEDLPVALVVACRPGTDHAGDVVARLGAHRLALTLQPAPLSASAVAALVRERFADCAEELPRACAEVTGGNPFLLQELLAALEGEQARPTAATAARVARYAPASIARSVLIRLARLPPQARTLARWVAVLGDDAALRHVATLTGVGADVAAGLVEALGEAGIVTAEEPLGFVHPLLRSALYEDVAAIERERMHARVARLLADECAPVERVAAHLLATRPLAEEWVVERLREAGQAAMARGAPSSAVSYLRRALAEPPRASVRVDVLVELGDAEATAGELAALDRLEEAVGRAPDSSQRARILGRLGRAMYLHGRLEGAAAAFDRAMAEPGGSEIAAELQAGWLAVARLVPALRAEARARIAPLLDRPDRVPAQGERVLLAHAAEQLAWAGEPCERARDLALRALGGDALLRDDGSEGPAWLIASAVLIECEDFEGCEPGIEAAFADARRRGSIIGFGNASYLRSWIAYKTGRLGDALADAEQAVESRRHGWQESLPLAYVELARTLVERGELERAAAALKRAAEDPRWARTSWYGFVLFLRGELELQQGDLTQARDDMLAAGELAIAAGALNPALGPWRSRAALALAQLGDMPAARRLSTEELELARRFGAPGTIGVALRTLGLVEGGPRGIDLLRESVAVLERSALRVEHARALVELGAALRRARDRAGARAPLRRGLELAHECGAGLVERRAREELLASGGRPRRTALSGVHALTPSERRVARLAADGLSNREIAQHLFLSAKTIEMHLGHVYGKLDIHSRSRLAGVLADGETPGT